VMVFDKGNDSPEEIAGNVVLKPPTWTDIT